MEDGGNNFPNLTTSDGGNWSGMAVDHGNVSCSTQVTGATVIRGGASSEKCLSASFMVARGRFLSTLAANDHIYS